MSLYVQGKMKLMDEDWKSFYESSTELSKVIKKISSAEKSGHYLSKLNSLESLSLGLLNFSDLVTRLVGKARDEVSSFNPIEFQNLVLDRLKTLRPELSFQKVGERVFIAPIVVHFIDSNSGFETEIGGDGLVSSDVLNVSEFILKKLDEKFDGKRFWQSLFQMHQILSNLTKSDEVSLELIRQMFSLSSTDANGYKRAKFQADLQRLYSSGVFSSDSKYECTLKPTAADPKAYTIFDHSGPISLAILKIVSRRIEE